MLIIIDASFKKNKIIKSLRIQAKVPASIQGFLDL